MLRHMIEMHRGEERSEVEFGVKVLRFSRKSFERQILESVLIHARPTETIISSIVDQNSIDVQSPDWSQSLEIKS